MLAQALLPQVTAAMGRLAASAVGRRRHDGTGCDGAIFWSPPLLGHEQALETLRRECHHAKAGKWRRRDRK
jgi:hypothetical protein